MPGNPSARVGLGETASVTNIHNLRNRCGRKRYYKKCMFSCTGGPEISLHSSVHCDFDGSENNFTVSSIQAQAVRRVPRKVSTPKRNPGNSFIGCNSSASNTIMEPFKSNNIDPSSSTEAQVNTNDLVDMTHCVNNEEHSESGNKHSSMPQSPQTELKEECYETEEEGDEIDSMTPVACEEVVRDIRRSKIPANMIDNFSSDEDMDDDDRLIIDDECERKSTPNAGNNTSRVYACHQCQMTTKSAKSYLHHFNTDHNSDFSIYECSLCEYASLYKQKLVKHEKLHHVNDGGNQLISHVSVNKFVANELDDSQNSSKQNSSFALEEADDMEEDNGPEISSVHPLPNSVPFTITAENIDQVLDEDKKKKKKTRQEVDPGKYFEAVDNSGTKYACSQCGNIYKWRKSLNKHWKEKHSMDPLVEVASPPGMLELLKSGKYTQLGARRIYDKTFLATIKTSKSDDPTLVASSPSSLIHTPSPPNFLTKPKSMTINSCRLTSPSVPLNPKMIGPFVSSIAQPVFPGMSVAFSLNNTSYHSPEEESALDLTRDSKPHSRNRSIPQIILNEQHFHTPGDQEQPLDFSKSSKPTEKATVEDLSSINAGHTYNQLMPKQHHCPKCDFTCTSEVEFANHSSSHLNKRIVKCYECKLQLNSMDELNNHFIKIHFQKLAEYKEAIKKIPHGLQQTYHILNMEIQDIGELGNQDLGTTEGKCLKCKKCDFEAKWPAELQKHAVSHSEERPYICMVCGSTYKWKWDLVKHFQKSHPNLPNPYRRNDKKDTPEGSSEDEDEPVSKRIKYESSNDLVSAGLYSRDDTISVEGIIAATQAGQRLISSQPNILDDEPVLERNLAFFKSFPFATNIEAVHMAQMMQAAQAAQEIDRHNKAHKAAQEALKSRQNSNSCGSDTVGSSSKKKAAREAVLSSPSPGSSKSEELPYKCTMCNYHARWPSEVTQHMKNHSDSKPYLCPRCEYRSKWKWDVVKHLKRCGGGGINDVIDTTKSKKREGSLSSGPPNAVVSQQGKMKKMTSQSPITYTVPSLDENDQTALQMNASSSDDLSRPESDSSAQDLSNSSNNNDCSSTSDNINNNYTAYANGLPFANINPAIPVTSSVSSTKSNLISSASLATPQHTTSTRHNSSGEVWNCPYCPFATQSQAELKRHSGLHSDDKPFKCDVCHYSTRWACDLKKHRKSYNHFPKSNALKDGNDKAEKPQPRFKCSQCIIYFHTLQCLVDHRLAEHVGQDSSQSSPAPQSEQEIDLARIKHPRKQVKQLQCPKCLFICKSRQIMDRHMEEHEQLEQSGIHCFYCSSFFKDRESLLDHISTHSAFNPKEWETFFMISEEEQHQLKADCKVISRKDNLISHNEDADKMENGKRNGQCLSKDSKNEKTTTDSTEARIQQILNEIPKQVVELQKVSHLNKFQCEWCPAEFANLTSLYKHASQAHPIQLKEQDVSMVLYDQTQQAYLPLQSLSQSKKSYTGEPIDILRQQVADKRNHQLMDKHHEGVTLSPKAQDIPNNKGDTENGVRCFSCDKCSFSSNSYTVFQQHCELHASKSTSQCWFCEYTVNSIGLLYQHMKISHTRKWKLLSQDPKYAAQIERISMAITSSRTGNSMDGPAQTAVDLSSRAKIPHTDKTLDIEYITKQQYIWSGIPVNIVPVGSSINFVCPHCSFHDASIAETCCHVVQSHRAMSKFTCKTCQFSDDNIHVMSDHCKKEHPLNERVVEVLDFKQINFSELQIVQLNALREQMAHDLTRKAETSTDMKSSTLKAMTCPFCPFKTIITEHMKAHISDHSRQARFQCHICDFGSDSTTLINEHIKVHETGYFLDHKPFAETKMMKREAKDRKLNENESKMIARVHPILESMEPSHGGQEDSPRSKTSKRIRYRCAACPYHTTCRSNMVKHLRQHNNNKKYKCTKCTYGAARAVLLKNHLDSHEAPTEDNGQHHDILCDPNFPNENFENNGGEEADFEGLEDDDDDDDDDDISDDIDEVDEKAIADLEAKDILEAEAAHRTSIASDNGDYCKDEQTHKQMCPHCPFTSNSVHEFHKHVSLHERYKCNLCNYSTDKQNLLTQHYSKLHTDQHGHNVNSPKGDEQNTNCGLQQETGTGEDEKLSETVNIDEEKNEIGNSQYLCQYCPYKAAKKQPFEIHHISHGIHKRYICDFCDWSADRMGLIYQHRKVHQNEASYNPTPEDKIFLNQEFDAGASGEFEAKFLEIKNSDKKVKEGEMDATLSPAPFKLTVVKKSYPCSLCPYKTSSKTSYSVHKSMHGSASEYTCSECSYASLSRGLLQQHLNLHTSPSVDVLYPAVKCKQQPFATSDKESENSANAVKCSTANPELKCTRCSYTAPSLSILREHVKGHIGQDSLICPYCDFTAVSKQVMFPHIQVHLPGAKLDPEALEQMLEQHSTNNNNNNSSSTHDDMSKSLLQESGKTMSVTENESLKMKRVYVCQFCEREFEAKQLMIQHEKQHVAGDHCGT